MRVTDSSQVNTSGPIRDAVRLMIVILVAMLLLALYANVQKFRRTKIEEVRVIPQAVASPPPAR